MKLWKRFFALALCACLLVLPGCQGQEEQAALYASLMAQRAEQLPEEPDPSTWRYLNMEPEPGDTLQGEVVIRGFWEGSDSLLADLSKEFMLQHPAVKITLAWEQSFMDGINASAEEDRAQQQAFHEELYLTMATGTADYVFFDDGWIDLDVATPVHQRGAGGLRPLPAGGLP